MKKIIVLFSLIITFSINAFSQAAYDQMKNLYDSKDYREAANYIQEAIKAGPKNQRVHLIAGDIYFELEKYDSCLAMYLKADDIDSKMPIVLRKISKAYTALGKHDEAIKAIKKSLKEDPKDVYSMLELGEAYIKADSIDQATLTITKARELNSNIAQPYLALGNLYFAQRIYELAKTNYESALKIDPNLMDAHINLAITYFKMANKEDSPELSNEYFSRSLTEWNIVSQKDPKNSRAWWEQSRILFFAKKFDMAAGALIKYLELRPDQKLARWYLAQSYFELNQCDSAVPSLRRVVFETDSVSIKHEATLKLAKCLFNQKNYKESVEEYEKYKATSKLDVKDLEFLAGASLKLGDTTKTISYYKEVLDIDPTRCNLMYQLANLTIYMKNYPDAIFFLDKRLANCKDSMSAKVYYLLGNCYFSLEKVDTAEALLKKSLELDPNNITFKIYLADIYANKKEHELAKEGFLDAIKIGLQDTARYKREINQAYSKLSGVLLENKSFKELEKLAKQWTEFDPNYSYSWLYLGIAYQGQGDKDNACKCYKKGAAIDKENQFFKKSLKQLECN